MSLQLQCYFDNKTGSLKWLTLIVCKKKGKYKKKTMVLSYYWEKYKVGILFDLLLFNKLMPPFYASVL